MSDDKTAMEAQELLFNNVYLPAFVEKCAARGIKFPDTASLQDALESVAILKTAESNREAAITKSAADTLRKAFKVAKPANAVEQKAAVEKKAAAAELGRNDKIRAAIDAVSK